MGNYNFVVFLESVRIIEYNIMEVFMKWRNFMDYFTSAEFAEKWGISQRRVAIYCKEGRIEGAVMKGRMWMIPENTTKPQDPRKICKIRQENMDKTND